MEARHPQGDNLPSVNVSPFERIASAAAGGYLLFDAIAHRGKWGLAKAIAGSYLLYRGTGGFDPIYSAIGRSQLPVPYKTINIRTRQVVNVPRSEAYAFWRKLENLPLFMKHLISVEKIDEKYSNWKATFPGSPVTLEWKAEIVKEKEGKFIGWSSTTDATIKNAGKVQFRDALNGNGTEVEVVISYHPPLGVVGSGIAKLFNKKLKKFIREDIQNFKTYIETGVNEKKLEERKEANDTLKAASNPLVKSAAEGLLEGITGDKNVPTMGQL